MNSILVASALLFTANAHSVDIPEFARNGVAYKNHQAKQLLNAKPLNENVTTPRYVDSICDHFSKHDFSTFKQKYFVDNTFWDGKGPILLYIGGEGTLTAPNGYVNVLAEKYNGLVVALEHRFYGDSIPHNSSTTENLKLLTVEQALADLNSFTTYFTTQSSMTTNGNVESHKNSQWFGFGGSYPGALASWYRTAYPDATVGTLSSSGVTNCIVEYTGFDKQVTAALGSECATKIRRVNDAYERMIGPKPEGKGWEEALDQFHCEKDMWLEDFYYMIADSWSMVDQYSKKTDLCDALKDITVDSTDAEITTTFSDFSNAYWGDDFCTGGFYNTNQMADPKRWDVNSRSWRWQTCYQVSYFNTAPGSGSLRNTIVDLDYHLKQCAAVFGYPMYPTSAEMNARYGGAEPKASNVFYSDFSDDPWLRASPDYSVSDSQPMFLSQCDDCGHCKDLHLPTEEDPEPIKQSRKEFENYMTKWLEEAKNKA